MASRFSTLSQIPKGVWIVGGVSMLMDISSEIIHSLLPLFMVTTLGASVIFIGLIEGLAEATALIIKVFSGAISDYLGKRKGLALLGYGLGAASKPLFALASSSGMILGARLIDRVGKGIRGAPRDALVADVTPPELRGAAYGLRQSMDTLGAFIGPLLAVGMMLLWHNDFRTIFWIAVIPGVLAVALLFFGLHEPASPVAHKRTNPIKKANLKRLGASCWWVVGLGAVFTLARFSEAFLVLRAQQSGIPLALIPLVMVAMNLLYAFSAYPFGKLSDAMSHTRLLQGGLVVLIAADIVLALSTHWVGDHRRRGAVGHSYGNDAGAADGDDCENSSRRPARNRLWPVQYGERCGAADCQPRSGHHLGNVGRGIYFLYGGRYLPDNPGVSA